MARFRRSFALLTLTAFGLVAPSALPAQAADPSSADRAARWITTQVANGTLDDGFSPVSASADGLIGLASAHDPALRPTIDILLASVKSGAAGYVASGGGAAAGKLAIVAAAYGIDPTDFGGVDLVAKIKTGVATDGSVGPYPAPFGSGLAAAGLERSGATTPAPLTTWLIAQQNADGGFGYAAGQASDADNTGLAIVGLLTDNTSAAKASLAKATAWAASTQKADGSWTGYVPVNSTCVLGSALLAAGHDESKALAYVKSQQLTSGAITDGTGANLMATSQCGPLLGGVSYLNVTWRPSSTTPSTTPSATASPSANPTATASPTATGSSSPSPSASASVSVTATTTATQPAGSSAHGGRGIPARTGVEDDGASWPVALAGLALAAAGALAGRRR